MQSTEPFTVTEKHELIALHRSLFEAQFVVLPHDMDVPGSPLLASLANRVVDLLSQQDPQWAQWRIASRHPERVEIVRQRLPSVQGWGEMHREEREMHIRNHLAPLIPDDALLIALVGDVA